MSNTIKTAEEILNDYGTSDDYPAYHKDDVIAAMHQYHSQFEGRGEGVLSNLQEMNHDILIHILKKVSLIDLSECEFEKGYDETLIYINALKGSVVIDAISYDGNLFRMMNNDESFEPLNPMISAYVAWTDYPAPLPSTKGEESELWNNVVATVGAADIVKTTIPDNAESINQWKKKLIDQLSEKYSITLK